MNERVKLKSNCLKFRIFRTSWYHTLYVLMLEHFRPVEMANRTEMTVEAVSLFILFSSFSHGGKENGIQLDSFFFLQTFSSSERQKKRKKEREKGEVEEKNRKTDSTKIFNNMQISSRKKMLKMTHWIATTTTEKMTCVIFNLFRWNERRKN